VTTAGLSPEQQAVATKRSWRFALLTPAETGRRNRRTIEGALLGAAAIVVGLTAVVARSAPGHDEDVGRALTTVLGWAEALWRVGFVGLLGLALVIVVGVLIRRRWDLVRDLLVAVLVLGAAGSILGRIVESDWAPLEGHLLSRWGYPELRLTAATAVLVVAGPELVHWARVLAAWLVPLATVSAVVLGAALPSAALGALALGLGAGAIVRLLFGSAAGVPPTEHVREAMAALGVEVSDLSPATRQHVGSAEYVGHDAEGRKLNVRVLGRDAQDTQRLARRWRLLAYRDPPRSAPVGRLEQVEHEGLATLMAAQAGVRVPGVVTAALGPEGDALFVTRRPDVDPLELSSPDQVRDETLRDLCGQVARLHAAGISHGRLNLSNVLDTDEGPMLVALSAATLGAPQSALDMDVAELLVACCVLVGPDRTLRIAVEAGWSDAVARVLPYLQRAALTPHLRDLARTQEVGLKELRAQAATATGREVPETVPLRRVRPKDVLTTVAVGFAAYLLITQLAEIGFGTIADSLRDASLPWVIVGLLLAQLTFVTSAISLRGAVLTPLPLLPCVVLASAVKFINLTVPSSAGRIAISVRFLQKMGAPPGEAIAAGAVDKLSETIVELVLVLALLPFVDFDIDTSGIGSAVPSGRVVGVIVLALVAIVVLVLAVPSVREKVVPSVRDGLSSLWAVAKDRGKRIELFGGNLGTEVLFALALGAVCHAYGVNLLLIQLLVINMAASALSSLIPVPGGVGAAEAGLTAGLVAVGVDESTAFAIALTHRLCTNYLPPIWGYFSLAWLERKGYV
jgi:glycosyltransferase 2 family protein